MSYITCEKRKNAPKINVIICEKKCKYATTCKTYNNYLKTVSSQGAVDQLAEREIINLHGPSTKQRPLFSLR